jgi:hypothetical protein
VKIKYNNPAMFTDSKEVLGRARFLERKSV